MSEVAADLWARCLVENPYYVSSYHDNVAQGADIMSNLRDIANGLYWSPMPAFRKDHPRVRFRLRGPEHGKHPARASQGVQWACESRIWTRRASRNWVLTSGE